MDQFNNELSKVIEDLINTFKGKSLPPKVYSLVMQSNKGLMLHIGIYYSLDEAIYSARKEFLNSVSHDTKDFIEIKMWAKLNAGNIISSFIDGIPIKSISTQSQTDKRPSFSSPSKTLLSKEVISEKQKDAYDYFKDFLDSKNNLLNFIITKKDNSLLEKFSSFFTENEKKFIIDKIKDEE